MTYYHYRRGESRGRDTYGYPIVTLRNTDTGKAYRTCGGGYDMLGTVLGEILENEHQEKLNKLHQLAESYYTIGEPDINKQGVQSRREAGRMSPNPIKHYYGLTAVYDTKGELRKVHIDGACGVSSVKTVAEAIGLSIKEIYDRGNPRRRNFPLLGVEIKPAEGLDKACAEQALYYGQTLYGRQLASREAAKLCEQVTETDE